MRKNILLLCFLLFAVGFAGCRNAKELKVYENTEDLQYTHEEGNITAVVTSIDLENNIIEFMNCQSGERISLGYHGGVGVFNTYGRDIGIGGIVCGDVVDVVYYADTERLVSITIDTDTVIVDNVNKLTVDKQKSQVTCNGKSYGMYNYVTVYDEDKALDIMEVNTEDTVRLYLYNNKLVSVVIKEGHGYVSLYNQDSYIGGMVEIGYDVIVPVTSEMLVAVKEGNYVLRITKNGYSNTKNITVIKGDETRVDISTIAVPSGTVTINVTPADAKVYINGNLDEDHIYYNLYGNYSLRVEAEGYNTFRGSFKIDEPVKTYDIKLKTDDDSGEDTTEDTEATDDTTEDSEDNTNESSATTEEQKDSEDSTENKKTDNVISVKTPEGVGVYLDGEYVGTAPVSFAKTVGTHTITLYKSGYLIKSYTIQANDDGKDDEYNFAALTSVLDTIQ